MASKQVTDREKSARAVGAAAETHAKEVGVGLASALTPYLAKGETIPDVASPVSDPAARRIVQGASTPAS